MTCSAARYLLVAGFAGVAVASLTGSDLFGLLAGVVAAVAVAAFERLGPGRGRRSCPLPTPAGRTSELTDGADRERTPG
jgi:hypothetical protein